MIRKINLNGMTIKYDLQYKKVKNINLRIKPGGGVFVSANRAVSADVIERFIISKTDFIKNALTGYESREPCVRYFNDDEIRDVILELCQRIYPYFERLGVNYPIIKFRKMVSQWGNCHSQKGILTFNLYLTYAPIECIEYVVAHEFTHFLQPNHSQKFYDELQKIMPDWKMHRRKLKEIHIRNVEN